MAHPSIRETDTFYSTKGGNCRLSRTWNASIKQKELRWQKGGKVLFKEIISHTTCILFHIVVGAFEMKVS